MRQIILLSLFCATIACLPSCTSEIAASVDWAKQKQAQNSAVNGIDMLNYNLGYWVDNYGFTGSNAVFGKESGSMDETYQAAAPATGKFGVRGGLEFIGKGNKYDLSGTTGTVHLNYLEVPVYATYSYPTSPTDRIFGGLGPYVAYGIGGKVSESGYSASSFGENNGGYKRFDAGLSLQAGYQYKLFTFTLSYDLGLVNVAYSGQDFTAYNRSFGLNVGYRFGNLFGGKK